MMVRPYTGLPRDVAATVPRRAPLRDSWIRHAPPGTPGTPPGTPDDPSPRGTSPLTPMSEASPDGPYLEVNSPTSPGSSVSPPGPPQIQVTPYAPPTPPEVLGCTGQVSRARALFEAPPPPATPPPLTPPSPQLAKEVTFRVKSPHRDTPARPRPPRRHTIGGVRDGVRGDLHPIAKVTPITPVKIQRITPVLLPSPAPRTKIGGGGRPGGGLGGGGDGGEVRSLPTSLSLSSPRPVSLCLTVDEVTRDPHASSPRPPAMIGAPQSTPPRPPLYPRFSDIPNHLLDALEESSVDPPAPSPPPTPPVHHHHHQDEKDNGSDDPSPPSTLIKENFRGFCTAMLDAAPRSTPPPQPPRPTTLDEELWAAGVYFRRPGAPPRPTSMPRGEHQGYGARVSSGVKENGGIESYTEENARNEAYRDGRSDSSYAEENALNAAYGKENANLEAYSEENAKYMPYRVSRVIQPSYSEDDSGKLKSRSEGAAKLESYVGESGKLKSRSEGPAKFESYGGESGNFKSYSGETSKYQVYRESKVTTSSYSENKSRNFAIMKSAVPEHDLDLEESVLRELDSSLAGLSGSESTSNSSTPSGGSVRGRGVMGGRGGTTTNTPPPESFNLIEEVMVETRSAPLHPPPSPPPPSTVTIKAYYQYPSVPPIPPPPQDSDSGHESGATSPCGTLTGEDGTADDSNHPALNSPQHPHQGLGVGVSVVGGDSGCVGVGGVCLEPRPPTHFVVVAIDFGTTYSGYAFSFTSDPDSVHMMKQWQGGDPGVLNQKTPTTLLLTPDQRFHSLGYQARDTYHDLDPSEAPHWLYFDKFKMVLHSEESLNLDTQIEAANGKRLPAIRVFSHALRYFRDHALRELSDQGVGGGGGGGVGVVGVLEEDVRWVITVPAIWSHPAKQFMRTAAYEAGMGSPNRPDQLLIALEPEVAAIYCRRLRRHQLLPPPPAAPPSARTLPPHLQDDPAPPPPSPDLDRDTVYAVVDCGGGTVDITVHQMTDRMCGHLKELHKATGGPHGSTGVDDEFVQLLVTIFGGDFMACFKRQRPAAFVDLMIAFEARKRNASPRRSAPLNIALPFSFIDLYRKLKGKDVESAVRKHQHLGVRWSSQGMLRLDPEAMHRLFLPTLTSITEAIEGVLASPEVRALQYMFLVGGFAESEVLQKHIRDAFSQRVRVVIPQGTGLAILRGAVQFGLDPGVVTVRRSRLTYGVGVLNRFNPAEHPMEKRVTAAGGEWCADVLDRFVGVDESVAVGDVVVRSYTPATPKQSTVILHLYATERHDVKFVTEPGVERVGTLHLDLGPSSTTTSTTPPSREISVHMRFGDTEVKASAVDHLTGRCVKADIDFLTL